MPDNELPITVDAKQSPACSSDEPQSTTAPETEESAQATAGLDLRGYELQDRLGGGGMGDVYRAGDPALGRDLAVKVMKADLQGYSAAEQRFLREARVTGSLQHPGIVPIHNLGRLADGRLHYTMRLVRGRTFADILRDEAGQPRRLPALLVIFEKICQAVAYAHSKRILHRDLKPANVMVGRFGEVQVMDWGLAKVLAAKDDPATPEGSAPSEDTPIPIEDAQTPLELTHRGREMGTPAYMPPEQALGEWGTVDERADVFALGAILCQILTGWPPYRGSDKAEVLHKAKQGDLAETLARLENCGTDAALRELCRDCLASARGDRPRNAEQVAHRVASYQAEVQERLRRAELERTAAVVQARWERKRRHWMLATAVLLLAGTAVSISLAVWAMKAADAERQAKDLAQNRLGEIEKANDVSMSIFRDLDPRAEEKGGPSLRVQLSQHLKRAATQLDEGAVGDMVATARLQTILGYSLMNLGQAKLAIELLSKAERTLEDKLGAEHAETFITRSYLGTAYWSAGRFDEAIRLHEQTLKQREAQFGADHPDTFVSRNNLALAYQSAGRFDEAIRLHEQTFKHREATLGADHLETLTSRNNLANVYWSAGRFNEAIRLHEQTVKQMETILGADHPDTLTSLNNLAEAYRSAGRSSDAIRLHAQALKQTEAKLGVDHPDTLTSRNNLASAYHAAGRSSDAIRLFEQTLKQRAAKLGADHPDTLQSRNNLAGAYQSVGRTAEAIYLHEQNLKQLEAKLGADHPDTLVSRNNLAEAYRSASRTTDAIRLHEQNLKQLETKLGADHPNTLTSRNNLVRAYRSAGRTTDAICLHEQTLKRREANLGANHLDTLISMANLGVVYREAGQLEKAIFLFETALQRGRQRSGGLPAPLELLPSALVETYEWTGRFEKAEPFYRDSLEQAQRQFGPDDPRTAGVLAQLGNNLLKQKKYTDAELLLRRCLKVRQAKQRDEWTTFNTCSALGEALLGQKKNAEAEPLLLQGYEGMKQRQDKIPPPIRPIRLSEALEHLVRLYEATEQKDKAADWRKKLQEAKTAEKKPKS